MSIQPSMPPPGSNWAGDPAAAASPQARALDPEASVLAVPQTPDEQALPSREMAVTREAAVRRTHNPALLALVDAHFIGDGPHPLQLVCLTENAADVECSQTIALVEPGVTWDDLEARIAAHAAECHAAGLKASGRPGSQTSGQVARAAWMACPQGDDEMAPWDAAAGAVAAPLAAENASLREQHDRCRGKVTGDEVALAVLDANEQLAAEVVRRRGQLREAEEADDLLVAGVLRNKPAEDGDDAVGPGALAVGYVRSLEASLAEERRKAAEIAKDAHNVRDLQLIGALTLKLASLREERDGTETGQQWLERTQGESGDGTPYGTFPEASETAAILADPEAMAAIAEGESELPAKACGHEFSLSGVRYRCERAPHPVDGYGPAHRHAAGIDEELAEGTGDPASDGPATLVTWGEDSQGDGQDWAIAWGTVEGYGVERQS